MRMNVKWLGVWAIALAAASAAPAQTWRQVGPPGGTVISLEADPHDSNKLYLGTSDGHVFNSTDEGAHWQLLSRIGTGQDDVITHILVDPRDSNRLVRQHLGAVFRRRRRLPQHRRGAHLASDRARA